MPLPVLTTSVINPVSVISAESLMQAIARLAQLYLTTPLAQTNAAAAPLPPPAPSRAKGRVGSNEC